MTYDPQLVERYIARARELRAQTHAKLMRQAWAGIKRWARTIGQWARKSTLNPLRYITRTR